MENEPGVVRQKCFLMDSIEERAQNMQQEVTAHRESQSQLRAEIEEKSKALASCREEMARLHEEHRQELGKMQQRLQNFQLLAADAKSLQEKLTDAARDGEVEARLW